MSRTDEGAGTVVLTVYLRPDLAEVTRVLQTLVLQPIRVEHFSAHLEAVDTTRIGRLEGVRGPVMRIVVTGACGARESERVVKTLNRLVTVYKVKVAGAGAPG